MVRLWVVSRKALFGLVIMMQECLLSELIILQVRRLRVSRSRRKVSLLDRGILMMQIMILLPNWRLSQPVLMVQIVRLAHRTELLLIMVLINGVVVLAGMVMIGRILHGQVLLMQQLLLLVLLNHLLVLLLNHLLMEPDLEALRLHRLLMLERLNLPLICRLLRKSILGPRLRRT